MIPAAEARRKLEKAQRDRRRVEVGFKRFLDIRDRPGHLKQDGGTVQSVLSLQCKSIS